MYELDTLVKKNLAETISVLENNFESNCFSIYGPIFPSIEKQVRMIIEQIPSNEKKGKLIVILNTPGGSAETVEKIVNIIRHHFKEVYFIVPDSAMSAGTILCMSGDKIYMDYSSSLGPIDPQVYNGKEWVPALGYLDQVNNLIEKSRQGVLTDAEFLILQNLDIAMLNQYEQAKNLTITLLKEWLVKYKFKNWNKHRTNKDKLGKKVTTAEKEQRAEDIALKLSDHNTWHSHGRFIGLNILDRLLNLEIDDYTDNIELTNAIRQYSELLVDYIRKHDYSSFLHSKHYF